MRQLNDSVIVKAPHTFALAFINTNLLERGPVGDARLALRFPLPNVIISGLTIEKSVRLKLASDREEPNAEGVKIRWEPVDTPALPSFSGTLHASAQSENTSRLTITGGYTPPGGIAGILFDVLVGIHIARATLAALLTQLAGGIEADYRARF